MPRLAKFRWSFPGSVCLFALRSACGTNNARYPVGWPPLSTKSLAGGCSDVAGKYVYISSVKHGSVKRAAGRIRRFNTTLQMAC